MCRDCGLVNESHMIDERAEWINNAEDGVDHSRVGAPTSTMYFSNMMSTIIPKTAKTWKISRLNDHGSMTYKDRSLHKTYVQLQHFTESVLHLPGRILDMAKELYKDIKEAKITRGDNHKALVACCIYFACRLCPETGCAREKIEIADGCGVDRSVFTGACKTLQEIVRDKPYYSKLFDENHQGDRSMIYRTIAPFFGDACSSSETWKFASRVEDMYMLARERSDGRLDAKTPHSIISALIFLTSERYPTPKPITKNDIRTICNVSTVTLNKTINLIQEILGPSNIHTKV